MRPQEIPSGFNGLRCYIAAKAMMHAKRRRHQSLWAQKIIYRHLSRKWQAPKRKA